MIDKLVHGLAEHAGLTREEVLDVLWLTAIGSTGQMGPLAPADDTLPSDVTAVEDWSVPDMAEASGGADPLPAHPASRQVNDADAPPATDIGFNAPRPLRDMVTLPMAVRRLRQIRGLGPRAAIDVDATVAATAEASLGWPRHARRPLRPVLSHPLRPMLDLALVVDQSPSMRIWSDVADDLERLLAQTSAFRSVSRWWLAAEDGTIHPHTRNRHHDLDDPRSAAVPAQPAQQLIDPSGHRLVLVVTDARDRSWYGQPAWDALSAWCTAMPTVLVQVLPSHYWADTAIGTPYLTSRALTPGAPNGQYRRRVAWWADDSADPPLPVVTLTEKSLDDWAQSVVNGTAWATGITATPPDPGAAPPAADKVSPTVAVNNFLAKATPGAQRLARILASADKPLSMPLIAVLRERLAPKTGITELAEIIASGLLEMVEPTRADEGPRLNYREGTRHLLYRGTTAFEEWDAFAAVAGFIEDRGRTSGPLRIRVPDHTGSARLDTGDKPFRAFHHAMAVRLGLIPAVPDLVAAADLETEAAAERQPDPVTIADDDRVGDRAALLDALAVELAALDDGREFMVVGVAADGITGWRVRRDANGTPRAEEFLLLTSWLADPMATYTKLLAPVLGDSRLLIVRNSPDTALSETSRLLGVETGAPTFECAERIGELLDLAIRNSPLTRAYELVVLKESPEGRLRMAGQPLFALGSASGDRTQFPVECAATDRSGTAFTVVAHRRGQHLGLDVQERVVQTQSAVIPPGIYTLTALLDGPGRVRFDGLPSPLLADRRPLAALMPLMPERRRLLEGVHLACLVEVGSDQARLRRAIDRLTQLIAHAYDGGQPLAVSVISYGSHAVARNMIEEPPTELCWAAPPMRALSRLRGLLDREAPRPDQEYPRAAQLECALMDLSGRLNERAGRPVVVTIGGRPPHPTKVDLYTEIIPCTRETRSDWRAAISLLQGVRGIRFGALCDPGAIGEVWRSLGRDAIEATNAEDLRHFARSLGLRDRAQAMPFPLAVSATRAVSAAAADISATANAMSASGSLATRIAVLGPMGSGTTTFLAALNKSLSDRPTSLELSSGTPNSDPLAEMTDLLTRHREFPVPTPGTDWFEWTLLQRGAPLAGAGASPNADTPVRVMHPAGQLVHPAQGGHERQTLIRTLAQAQGIIYMFDPIREIVVGDAFETAEILLGQLVQEVKDASPGGFDGKLKQHLAVCLTKFDDEEILPRAVKQGLVTIDSRDPYLFPRVREDRARDFFIRFGAAVGGTDVNRLLSTFDRYFHRDRVGYFITSAIGFYVDPAIGRYNPEDPYNVIPLKARTGRQKIRGDIHPINVVEPMLWLAEQIPGANHLRSRHRTG